jgi:4-aminobutyrate aminotransferase / (S)-3-amino-2-methylpropionate transaminase / 5-aminovalerate transaminase
MKLSTQNSTSTTNKQYAEFILPAVANAVEPVVVSHAKGVMISDTEGKEYLDCFSGISVVNAGHTHPRVVDAAKKQMEELTHCCSYVYQVPVVGQLAQKLSEITPGKLKKSFFSNSGAEAVEGAMRLAKQATGRREMISLGYSFHGRTTGALSLTGNSARKRNNGPYLSGVAFAPTPYCYRCPFKLQYPSCDMACAHALNDTIKQQTSGNVAAFIAEPILGEGGILVPPEPYFEITSKMIHEHGGLFIVDEVQTGFGRTGKMFGIEHYPPVEADIMTTAKGIANGFPLGAFTAREPISEAMQPGDHLSTFGGNPVSCAAAIANIEVIEKENLIENSAARGLQIMARLKELHQHYSLIGDIRGKGLMIGVELVRNRQTKEPADKEAKEIRTTLRENGLLVGVGGALGNVVRFQPPLCISKNECDRAMDLFEQVLKKVDPRKESSNHTVQTAHLFKCVGIEG